MKTTTTIMTMRGETTPQPYEVWRILFVFDDQPDVFKFRPVIIGGIGKGGVELMLLSVKVTSHPPRQGIEGEIPLLDWQAAGSLGTRLPSLRIVNRRLHF
ncbi:hypothetical protein [Sutterella wadsworthensis]|uniref:hypothetical protein n=2 Tax=Sutterella wadsworthensis TaxID=40545 RepID=UPI00266BEFC0|nr:hypothetical protein [Sutterella wadsworthensis]